MCIRDSIKLGEYPNQQSIAATQNIDVISGIPTGITLSAEDADLDPLTMRLTKAPVSGSLYKTISIEPESTYASKAKSYDIVLSNDQKTGYLADGTSGLTIIDLEINPLTVLSSLDTEGLARSVKLSKDGRTAFLADGTLGLKVIDVSDSLNPIIISSIAVGESVYDLSLIHI